MNLIETMKYLITLPSCDSYSKASQETLYSIGGTSFLSAPWTKSILFNSMAEYFASDRAACWIIHQNSDTSTPCRVDSMTSAGQNTQQGVRSEPDCNHQQAVICPQAHKTLGFLSYRYHVVRYLSLSDNSAGQAFGQSWILTLANHKLYVLMPNWVILALSASIESRAENLGYLHVGILTKAVARSSHSTGRQVIRYPKSCA